MSFAKSSLSQGRRAILTIVVLGLLLWPATAEATRSPRSTSPSATDTSVGADATITTNWSDACETPPAAAVDTLNEAAALWGTWISSTVPIQAEACWTSNISIPGAEGTGRPTTYVYNPPGGPLVNTYYPVALANALGGTDGIPGGPEIIVQFDANSDLSLATALHELAHGLGFIGGMAVTAGVGECGLRCPTPYDQSVVDSTGTLLLDYLAVNPITMGRRLTVDDDAHFGGPNTVAANGGVPAKLYTPPSWGYSSLSHLDRETFQYTQNALMAPSAAGDHPGPVGLAILQDMGWLRVDGVPNVVTSGPQIVGVDQATTFDGELVWSGYAEQSITYTWTADGQSPVTHTSPTTRDSATFTWTTPGRRRIILTATDGAAAASATRDALVYAVDVGGPAQAHMDEAVALTASVTPEIWTHPITYTWEATDQTRVTHVERYAFDDGATLTWHSAGAKSVIVTAHIGEATIQSVHTIHIEGSVLDRQIFLPLVLR